MSIKYKKTKQITTDREGNIKEVYFARACKRHRITLDVLTEDITTKTSLSRAEVNGVIMTLADTIPKYLLMNCSVDLGDLGTISLHFTSESSESEEDITWRSIKDMRVQFRAGKHMKEQLEHAHFELVKDEK